MTPSNQCILLASLKPDLTYALRLLAEQRMHLQLREPIDPRDGDRFVPACAAADILLIEAKDLLWLWENQPEQAKSALNLVQAVVILSEAELLEVATRLHMRHGLLLCQPNTDPPIDLLPLILEGYVVIPQGLVHRLATNQLRLDIAHALPSEMQQTLGLLGAAYSNLDIATRSGAAESRVKTMVRIAMQKLHMRNRTDAAVFALSTGLAQSPDTSALRNPPVKPRAI